MKEKKVLLLLAEGFEIYEASAFIDVMGWNMLEGDKSTRLITCGATREVTSTFGVTLAVDITLDDIDYRAYDALAVPGGFADYGFYESAYDYDFLRVLQEFNIHQKPIASICTGALPLGKAGALWRRNATTYNLNPLRQQELADFGATVVNRPVVTDGHIISSWNPSTSLQVAFTLLEWLTSESNTLRVKKLMGF